jgi:hypothetical protein
MKKPLYLTKIIAEDADFDEEELMEILDNLDFFVQLSGQEVKRASKCISEPVPEILYVTHYNGYIGLSPGNDRYIEGGVFGEETQVVPQRVMFEDSFSVTSSFIFNPKDLGLEYDTDLVLEIRKSGFPPVSTYD